MEKSRRQGTPLRTNALLMALIAAALVVFVVIVIGNPSTELIVALVAPVVVGCVAVMDKLCSPEPRPPPEPVYNDDYTKSVIALYKESLHALRTQPSGDSDVHQHQGDRERE